MTPNPTETNAEKKSSENNPEWMTIEYFKDIVEAQFPNFCIKDIKISSATGKGDNFTAILHRADLEIYDTTKDKKKHISYVVKSLPSAEGIQLEMMKQFNVFPKEIQVYDEFIPAFEKILSNVGINTVFGPKCYKVNTFPEPTDIIVMEDLLRTDHRLANRQTGLDMDHCKILLDKLAKFHAASMVYYELNGPFKKPFDEGMYCKRMKPMFDNAFDLSFKSRITEFEKYTFGKHYVEKMKSWIPNKTKVFDHIIKVVQPSDDDNGLNCLIHGDLWTNNMLFLYDNDNNVKDVSFIDFQLSFWSSPAIDLNYFIISSTTHENRLKEFDHFIAIYHKSLEETLKKLNYMKKIPTLIELHSEVIKKGFYVHLTAISVLPVVLLEPRDDASIENMLAETEEGKSFKDALYRNPLYVKAMEQLLPFLENRGYLDVAGIDY